MRNLFKVEYLLKTTAINNGEFLIDQKEDIFYIYIETNNLNEIFTDLFDLHRHDGIIGIEILSVEEQNQSKELREIHNSLFA